MYSKSEVMYRNFLQGSLRIKDISGLLRKKQLNQKYNRYLSLLRKFSNFNCD